jgi:putative nucleotidyltransferase with HDIG domain
MEPIYKPKPNLEKTLLAACDRVPVRPQAHQRVLEALGNPDLSIDALAAEFNKDIGLTAHVLKMANSVAFSPTQQVCSTTQAVSMIGTIELRAIVENAWLFQMMDQANRLKGFDSKIECEHALEVAMETLRMAEEIHADEELAETAFTAGLLHDVGKTLIAVHAPETYAMVSEEMEKRAQSRWQIEKALLGFNHANIGGSLLQSWGLGLGIVNAVKWHHEPDRLSHQQISALTLVHLADCTARKTGPDASCKARWNKVAKAADPSRSESQNGLSKQAPICHT